MSIRIVNIGIADKGNGDPIRTAFDKINKNFQDLNNDYINLTATVSNISTTASLTEFDFGKIKLNVITDPLQLMFYTADIDLGKISEPALVEYDAGDFE
jgi:hypothetical protein